MTTVPKGLRETLHADKEALMRILAQQDALTGFVPDRTMTIQEVRAQMIAEGVRPEDNIASCEIIQQRESQ